MPAAIMGAIAGSRPDKSSQNYSSNTDAGSATGAESTGQSGLLDSFSKLTGMANAGPGQSDVSNAYGANKSLADMLKNYSQGGFLPNQQDVDTGNSMASRLFQPQQVALQQSFLQQGYDANKQAALMGRDINDPILQAKLRVAQTQQSQMLGAEQGSMAQNLAMQMPGQRLGYMQSGTNVLNGLASQAMANRQALAQMGEGIMQDERNFRLSTARRYGNQSSESGGGLKGALQGGMAGLGQDLKMAGGMGAFGGTAPTAEYNGTYGGGMGGFKGGFSAPAPASMSIPSPSSSYSFNPSPSGGFGLGSSASSPNMPFSGGKYF